MAKRKLSPAREKELKEIRKLEKELKEARKQWSISWMAEQEDVLAEKVSGSDGAVYDTRDNTVWDPEKWLSHETTRFDGTWWREWWNTYEIFAKFNGKVKRFRQRENEPSSGQTDRAKLYAATGKYVRASSTKVKKKLDLGEVNEALSQIGYTIVKKSKN